MSDRPPHTLSVPRPSRREYAQAVKRYAAALAIFLSSRVLVLLAIFFSATFIPQNPAGEFWNANSRWYHYLLRYDSGWYLRIARDGYTFNGDNLTEQPVIFYPLYPLLTRLLRIVLGIDYNAGALLIANAAAILAIFFLYKLVADDYGKEVGFYAVALMSFFPTSLFYSSGYTESLTLLLILGFFLLLRNERYVLAACCAGLALGTRSTGIVLLAPLMWELWRKFAKQPKGLLLQGIVCVTLATSGLWLYMTYLWFAFRAPLAFITGQQAWLHGNQVGSNVFQMLTLQPFSYLRTILDVGPTPNTLDPWFFLLFLAVIVLFRKGLRTSYFLFSLGVLLLPYITLSTNLGFRSFTRYTMLAFPCFILMARQLKPRAWAGLSVLGLFAALLFMYTAMFAQWYWAG